MYDKTKATQKAISTCGAIIWLIIGGLWIFSALQTTGVCCSICLSTLEQMKHSSIMFVSITTPTLWAQHLFQSTQKHKLYFRTKCKYCWD